MKKCRKCNQEKPESAFSKRTRGRLMADCSECVQLRRDLGGYRSPAYRHAKETLRRYGITKQEYDALFNAQNGRCAICKRPPTVRRLAVDHRHKDGKVRGLLCWKCNKFVLGGSNEKLDILREAVAYLEKYA
jgi:hypothetical protein